MNMREYEQRAMALRLPTADSLYALFNLVGEVGEFFSKIAKERRDGAVDDTDPAQLKAFMAGLHKELGDILWQLTAVAADCGTSLEDIAKLNLEKLEGRKASGTLQGSGDNR